MVAFDLVKSWGIADAEAFTAEIGCDGAELERRIASAETLLKDAAPGRYAYVKRDGDRIEILAEFVVGDRVVVRG
jgi:hypothetical protein